MSNAECGNSNAECGMRNAELEKRSRLDELIQELCPNGVEYRPLWSVTIWDKKFNSVDRKKQPSVISYPYLLAAELFAMEQDGGDVFLLSTGEQTGWTTEERAGGYLCNGEVVTMPWGKSRAVTDCIKYYKGKFVTADNRIMTSNDTQVLNNKYLYYWFMSVGKIVDAFYRGSGIKHPDMAKVLDMQIPVPPLPVQSEIVRILDNFTELTAELTARKKQYEFYRDKLLTFSNAEFGMRNSEWRTLAEVAEISTGSSNTDDAVEGGCYPFFVRSQQPLAKNEYEYDEEAIITAGDGVGVGKVFHYINGKYALHQRAYRIHPATDELFGKYLYHYFVANFPKYIAQQMFQGSVPSIRRPMLNKFQVAIPPLDVQKRLAEVLDNFEAICADLNIGLPAEIEARQKQYEFYRDALLTYAATGATIFNRQTDEYNAVIRLCQYVFGYVLLSLETLFDIRNGYTPSKANAEYWENGTVDWFRMEDIRANGHVLSEALQKVSETAVKGGRKISANSIALATSATIGEHALITVECLGNQRFSFFSAKAQFIDVLNMHYMNYYFYKVDEWCKGHLFQGNFNTVDIGALKQLCIPLPPIEEQERIVSILDRFDSLCNDITVGLPAEIEARQKQYEYYRDKLLSFRPICN
jgi:restriction endonuclease S subunit